MDQDTHDDADTAQDPASGGIVVGHDGSRRCDEVVLRAGDLARRLAVPLHVVRVWSWVSAPRPASWRTTYVPPMAEFEQAVLDDLRADVEALALAPEVVVRVRAVKGQQVAERLVRVARGAEMLVVGARGAGGFSGLTVGSTVSQVVRHSTVPVLVVPNAGG